MQPYRLAYFSATATEIPILSQAVVRFRESGGNLEITARTRSQLFDESRQNAFVKEALAADVVIVALHGGQASCPAFEQLVASLEERRSSGEKAPHFHVQPIGSDEEALFAAEKYGDGFGQDTWDTLNRYITYGGPQNFLQMLIYINNLLFGEAEPLVLPEKVLQEGVYHPDYPAVPDLEEYLAARVDPRKLTVGLWFYQTYWLNNNLQYIDVIIREIEKQGANVLPVFHVRYPDKTLGNHAADYTVDTFFLEKGRPRIDVLLNPMMFSLTIVKEEYKKLLPKLNVPFIQAMTSLSPYRQWKESWQGMSTMDVSFNAAQPEFDGALINVPVATREEDQHDPITGALLSKLIAIPDRVERLVSLSLNWARLRRKPNAEKRIAIVYHHYPPRNDRIGCAVGLDSFASVKLLLERMADRGYQVERFYDSGDAMAEEVLEKMTYDRRWLTPERMADRALAKAGPDDYLPWHTVLPEATRNKMTGDWGTPPGDLFVHNGELNFAGFTNGNVFITMQPPRGYLENADAIIHDLYLSPPHHYLMKYRWIKHVFKADAVIHVGKHGSLEWLPGKALGLSEECYPDLAIMDLPNIYPYIINDPSEGTQAKRRSYCCIIDHLTPAFTNADLYEDMAKVENHLRDYDDAKREDPGKMALIRPMIWEAVTQADLDKDLEISEAEAMQDFDGFLQKLHAYLEDMADTMISDGLHTLGTYPEGKRLEEFVVQLTRLANGDVPSLRESILEAMGLDYDELVENKGKVLPGFQGKTGGQIIREAHEKALQLAHRLAENDYQGSHQEIIAAVLGQPHAGVAAVLDYICQKLVPNIRLATEEIDAALNALEGGFVEPGPSGAPSRGQADILPTGRNFYSVDPLKIPSPAAWELGKRLGDALLERYLNDTGKYPESVGIILWGIGTMRTKGDDLAEILYLMGVKPVWQPGSGNVAGVEIIPRSELGRPRIDVVPRISGFFRDSFPNLVELIDQAVQMVAVFDDPLETNMIRRHVLQDIEEYLQDGRSSEEAFREATFRVFGCPPGTYGAGVKELIEAKAWENQEDLANNYIRYSSHAYGRESYGKQKPQTFRRLLSRMDVTVKNEDTREYDMFSCTDYYNYYGGLIVAVKAVRGELPFAMVGDSSDPKRVKMRTTFEEAKHVFRSRLLNPKWIEGLKRHGYKGAGDLSKMMDVVLGWDATAEVVEDFMYERFADKYALDPEMQKWMKEVNPYALQNILDKLLEAIKRGMWNASPEMTDKLRDAYLDIEGEIEEVMS
ncbi:MAG: cobaltochelatase subunit CobN [Thermodesulfobacteriota bacterium]